MRQHPPADRLARQEHALEIGVDDEVPARLVHGFRRRRARQAGGRHEAADGAEPSLKLGDGRLGRCCIAHVERQGHRLAARTGYRLGDIAGGLRLEVGDTDACSCRGKSLRRRQADAGRPAGDHDHMAGKVEGRVHGISCQLPFVTPRGSARLVQAARRTRANCPRRRRDRCRADRAVSCRRARTRRSARQG